MPFYYTTEGIRGIGDSLFITAIARAFKKLHPYNLVAVRNKNYQLYYNNPDIDLLISGFDSENRGPLLMHRNRCFRPQIVGSRWLLNYLANIKPFFGKSYNAHHGWPPQKRLLTEISERCGLSLSINEEISLRPWFWPYCWELSNATEYQDVICIQSNAATYWTPNKQWPINRFQQVINNLKKKYRIIQIGITTDSLLEGVEDLRGKTSLRQTAAILAKARLLIGMEGGLMHLARAVDTRSVIIFTGFITPPYSGYDCNINLFGPIERSDLPCWNLRKCNCDCADRITVDQVLIAVEKAISLPPLQKHYIIQ
jgi:hypothetical protein